METLASGAMSIGAISSTFIIHYLGDHTVLKGFKHHNSKVKVKPFVTSAPHVKEKVNYFSYTVYIITLA